MASFGSNVLRLGTGHAAAQLINIATIPIITRLYSPKEFGYYSVYLSIATVLAPLFSLRFANFVVLPDDDRDGAALLQLALFMAGSAALLLTPAVLWCVEGLFRPSFESGVFRYLWWLPLGILCLSFNDSFSYWNLRRKQFGVMSRARMIEVLCDRFIGVTFGLLSTATATTLIIGRMVGPITGTIYSLRRGVFHSLRDRLSLVNRNDLRRLFIHYRSNAVFSAIAALASAGSREMPAIVIAVYYGAPAAGFYGLCLRVLNLPLMTVGDVIARVHYQHVAARVRNGEEIVTQLFGVLKYMFYIVFPGALFLIWFGEPFFRLVFGARWGMAGSFAQVLVPGIVFTFLHRVPSVLFDVLFLNRARLVFETLLLAGRLSVLVAAGSMSIGVVPALYGLVAVTVVVIVLSTFYLFSTVGVGPRRWAWFLTRMAARFWPILAGFPLVRFNAWFDAPARWAATVILLAVIQVIVLSIHDVDLNRRLRAFPVPGRR